MHCRPPSAVRLSRPPGPLGRDVRFDQRADRNCLNPSRTMPADSITEDTTLAAVPTAVSADLEGEAVVLDTAAGEYYGFNEVGSFIWTLLQEPMTFAELIDALLDEYGVDRDRCEAEVRDLLGQMMEKNLLEIQPAGSRPTESQHAE